MQVECERRATMGLWYIEEHRHPLHCSGWSHELLGISGVE
jgi:hypothetical protein